MTQCSRHQSQALLHKKAICVFIYLIGLWFELCKSFHQEIFWAAAPAMQQRVPGKKTPLHHDSQQSREQTESWPLAMGRSLGDRGVAGNTAIQCPCAPTLSIQQGLPETPSSPRLCHMLCCFTIHMDFLARISSSCSGPFSPGSQLALRDDIPPTPGSFASLQTWR